MKTTFFVISLLACLISTPLQGQNIVVTNFHLSVSKWATGEGAPPAAFYLTHDWGTNLTYPLRVYYEVSGTASNDVDYEYLPGYVDFAIGTNMTAIPIVPLDDSLVEGNEMVYVTLMPCPTNAPYPYTLPYRKSNAITIVDNDPSGNIPPSVTFLYPQSPCVYSSPGDVALAAWSTDMDGFVQYVEFFADGTRLGVLTNASSNFGIDQTNVMVWANPPPGTYSLTAVATDQGGATRSTSPQALTVLPLAPEPVVSITASKPNAGEEGFPGVFTISCIYPPGASGWWSNHSFRVYYEIGGTALNGVDYRTDDYQPLRTYVTFPARARTMNFWFGPIDDNLVEGDETVEVRLYCPAATGNQPSYTVGYQSNAVVTIADNDPVGHSAPVKVGSEAHVYTAPATYNVFAWIVEPADTVYTVEVFEGTNSLGQRQWDPRVRYFVDPLSWYHLNMPTGTYTYTAVFTNALGQTGVSAPWTVTVIPPVPPVPPVVTIRATDPSGSEIPVVPPGMGMPQGYDPGMATVSRTGDTTRPLTVFYFTRGTAQNGFDYERLSNYVVIPAGDASAQIMVSPIDDNLVEGTETVWVQLRPAVLPYADNAGTMSLGDSMPIISPAPYEIGSPSNAVVTILDDDAAGTNIPPKVQIVRPMDRSFFRAGANVLLVANSSDLDGSIASVEFFAGEKSLGLGTPPATTWGILPADLFCLVWSNVPAGPHVLSARATDNLDASAVSAFVHITVLETNLPPVTNTTPVVSIAAIDPVASEGKFDFPTTVIVQTNLLCPTAAGFSGSSNWTSLDPSTSRATYWTNVFCGTNTATFEVRRSGPTNIDLIVYYAIHGTASSGLDYVALPGSVTIPAGRRAARVVIVPIDDTLGETNETIVLRLVLPPDSTLAPYLIGTPARAGAVITENDYRLARLARLNDGSVHVSLPVADGSGYRLEWSSDLADWTSCLTDIAIQGDVHYIDSDAPSAAVRFYRLVPEPLLSPED